jgi:flagellar assembly factor FliW
MTAKSATKKATPLSTDFVVQSDLLGTFRVRLDATLEFPNGLLGFPDQKRFALVQAGTNSVYWLQSLGLPSLVFLLVDPFAHFNGYVVDIPPADAMELGASDPADVAVLAIVTLPAPTADGERPTANLQGPIVINLRQRRGKQIVVADADYGVRVPFDLARE